MRVVFQLILGLGFVLLVACASKKVDGSGGYCVPKGQKCTGVKAYNTCVNKCVKKADCNSSCSKYNACVKKCDCDDTSCASDCSDAITSKCETCQSEIAECALDCDEPECTPTGSGDDDDSSGDDDDDEFDFGDDEF